MISGLPQYAEVPPGPALLPYVQCYWSIRATAAPSFFNRVCPDGCADVIVDLAATLPGTGCVEGQCAYAVGTMQQASCIELAGTVDLSGGTIQARRRGALFSSADAPVDRSRSPVE